MLRYGDNKSIDSMMDSCEKWMSENDIWHRRSVYNRFFTEIGTLVFDEETLINGRVFLNARHKERAYKDIDFIKDLLVLDKETALAV